VVPMRCLKFGMTSARITIGGDTYWLDLRDNKNLQGVVQSGASVWVTGEIDDFQGTDGQIDFLVKVADVRADDSGQASYVRKTGAVEIRGRLQEDRRDIYRPFEASWYVAINGKEYFLDLKGNKTLIGQLKDFAGLPVVVTGTSEVKGRWNIVHVASIKAAPASPFKITFSRTSGIPDFRPTADVTFDSTKLSPKTAD